LYTRKTRFIHDAIAGKTLTIQYFYAISLEALGIYIYIYIEREVFHYTYVHTNFITCYVTLAQMHLRTLGDDLIFDCIMALRRGLLLTGALSSTSE